MRRFLTLLFLFLALPLTAQTPDAACLTAGRAARDSLAKLHLPSVRDTTRLTTYQQRAYGSLSTILALKCTLPKPDTVIVPEDSTPPVPHPVTLALALEGGDTLRIRPTVPFMVFLRATVDSGGATVADSAAFTLSDTSLARSFWNKTARRLEVFTLATHTKSGALTVTATRGALSASRVIFVSASAPPPPPIDTTTPVPPPVVTDSTALGILSAMLGPTRTAADAAAHGLRGLDSLYQAWADKRWTVDWLGQPVNNRWAATNYYDGAKINYWMWARTGNPVYRARGDSIALNYRTYYIEANNYAHAIWWWMPDGLALHYRLTGDTLSLKAVARGTLQLEGYFRILGDKTNVNIDSRNRARILQSYLVSWQLGAPQLAPAPWATRLDTALTRVLNAQSADGAWRDANRCNSEAAFMGAMVDDQLIRINDHYRADPRIVPAIGKHLDFLWAKMLVRPATGPIAFKYTELASCRTVASIDKTVTPPDTTWQEVGGAQPADDLNGFFPHVFAWYGHKTGDRSYIAKADTLLRAAIAGGYMHSGKHFNQVFTVTPAALPWLPY